MRILGLDIGSRRIGVAISDELGITAQGLQTITRESTEQGIEEIRRITAEFGVTEIVVGLPLNMNGSKGEGADEVLRLVEILKEELNLPVKTWDERLTTMEAERLLISSDMSRKRRKHINDRIAAQLILQSYLAYRKEKNQT
jgi:putative Holliday junction resolvase